jgi:hypothetical protein
MTPGYCELQGACLMARVELAHVAANHVRIPLDQAELAHPPILLLSDLRGPICAPSDVSHSRRPHGRRRIVGSVRLVSVDPIVKRRETGVRTQVDCDEPRYHGAIPWREAQDVVQYGISRFGLPVAKRVDDHFQNATGEAMVGFSNRTGQHLERHIERICAH